MKIRLLLSLVVVASVAACAKPNTFATGGSRADATVVVSHGPTGNGIPPQELANMTKIAAEKCQAWGYRSAEAFGGYTSHCTAPSAYGCLAYRHDASFQCLGTPGS